MASASDSINEENISQKVLDQTLEPDSDQSLGLDENTTSSKMKEPISQPSQKSDSKSKTPKDVLLKFNWAQLTDAVQNLKQFLKKNQIALIILWVSLLASLVLLITMPNKSFYLQLHNNIGPLSTVLKKGEITPTDFHELFYDLPNPVITTNFLKLLMKGTKNFECFLPDLNIKKETQLSPELEEKKCLLINTLDFSKNPSRLTLIAWSAVDITTRNFILNRMFRAYYVKQVFNYLASPIYDVISFNALKWPHGFIVTVGENPKNYIFLVNGSKIDFENNLENMNSFTKQLSKTEKTLNHYVPNWISNIIHTAHSMADYVPINIENSIFSETASSSFLFKMHPYLPIVILPFGSVFSKISTTYIRENYINYIEKTPVAVYLSQSFTCEEISDSGINFTPIQALSLHQKIYDYLECVSVENNRLKKNFDNLSPEMKNSNTLEHWLNQVTGISQSCSLPKNLVKTRCLFTGEILSLITSKTPTVASFYLEGKDLINVLSCMTRKVEIINKN